MACGVDIGGAQVDEIAAPQLAGDGHVEQRETPPAVSEFEAHANGPDVLWKKGRFCPTRRPLFQAE